MLIKEIISKYILNLLTTIHNNYPEQFTNINIDQEYKYILDTINFNILTTENINSNSDSNSNIKNSTTSVKRLVNENERCNARVWGFIYNNNNNNAEKIVKIDKIFIVDDYNDIDTDKFNKMYKLGQQCKKKCSYGSKYCYKHYKINPHGDYSIPPSAEIILHYLQDGKYIKK